MSHSHSVQERDWTDYWRILFPKVTVEDIRSFEQKYKGSEEEEEDLKAAYLHHEGDMDRIMEEVSGREEEGGHSKRKIHVSPHHVHMEDRPSMPQGSKVSCNSMDPGFQISPICMGPGFQRSHECMVMIMEPY